MGPGVFATACWSVGNSYRKGTLLVEAIFSPFPYLNYQPLRNKLKKNLAKCDIPEAYIVSNRNASSLFNLLFLETKNGIYRWHLLPRNAPDPIQGVMIRGKGYWSLHLRWDRGHSYLLPEALHSCKALWIRVVVNNSKALRHARTPNIRCYTDT